jgi:hypothetical protein
MQAPFVLICGLPGSGNRMLKALIRAAGGESLVRHGNTGAKFIVKAFEIHPDRPHYALIPVRFWHAESASNPWARDDRQKDECVSVVMRTLADLRIPTRMVSYESLFLYPDQARIDILTWVGLDPATPWPNPPRDENAKWHKDNQ